MNQNTVIVGCAKDSLPVHPLIMKILDKNIGIVQLPCPEFSMYGLKRWAHVKDQFENTHFKKTSKDLLQNTINNVIDYKNAGYEIVGIVGIAGSPSCSVNKVHRGLWQGTLGKKSSEELTSTIQNTIEVNESGVFMDVLKSMLKEEKIDIPFYDDLDEVITLIEG